jgi:hypothetical protein
LHTKAYVQKKPNRAANHGSSIATAKQKNIPTCIETLAKSILDDLDVRRAIYFRGPCAGRGPVDGERHGILRSDDGALTVSETGVLETAVETRIGAGLGGLLSIVIWAFDPVTKEMGGGDE